jgi:hypothetical protein
VRNRHEHWPGDSPELAALGEAIGLLDASSNLDPDWFSQPLTRLAQAVATPQQRDALVRFVNLALPPVPEPGRPARETWHPLLGTQDRGNLYLTLLLGASSPLVTWAS